MKYRFGLLICMSTFFHNSHVICFFKCTTFKILKSVNRSILLLFGLVILSITQSIGQDITPLDCLVKQDFFEQRAKKQIVKINRRNPEGKNIILHSELNIIAIPYFKICREEFVSEKFKIERALEKAKLKRSLLEVVLFSSDSILGHWGSFSKWKRNNAQGFDLFDYDSMTVKLIELYQKHDCVFRFVGLGCYWFYEEDKLYAYNPFTGKIIGAPNYDWASDLSLSPICGSRKALDRFYSQPLIHRQPLLLKK